MTSRESRECRKARREFIERGIASGAAAQASGAYISADRVLGKLGRRLGKVRALRK